MRIGLIAADLTFRHGWAHYSLSVARALLRAGVEVIILTAEGSPPLADAPALPILPSVDPLARGMLARQFTLIPRVRRALAACTVIHTAVELYAPLASAAAADEKPLVITGHGTYVRLPLRPFPAGTAYRRAFLNATLACVSQYTEQQAQIALPGVRTVVIPNGVDAARFAEVVKIAHSRPTVISVGAVKARKGTIALVHAVAHLRARLPEVRCFIVGSLTAEPAYARAVAAEIDRLGLEHQITLTGQIGHDELLALYGQADVFALPSINVEGKFEGYGLALLEAGAAGLPVIGSRDCGAETAVDDGVTGLLVPQIAPHALAATDQAAAAPLADALHAILSDPDRAAHMGEAGRAKASAQTWDRHAQALIALYRELGA